MVDEGIVKVIGIIAGICTAVSLIPQIVKIKRDKKAEDISIVYLSVLMFGLILWIIYGILRKDIPVIATNIASVIVNIWTMILRFKYRR